MEEENIIYYGGDYPLSSNECYYITNKPEKPPKKTMNIKQEIIQHNISLEDIVNDTLTTSLAGSLYREPVY